MIEVSGAALRHHVVSTPLFSDDAQFRSVGNIDETEVQYCPATDLLCKLSLKHIAPFSTYVKLSHHFAVTRALSSQATLIRYLQSHQCDLCEADLYCFRIIRGPHIFSENDMMCVEPPSPMNDIAITTDKLNKGDFPPIPQTERLIEDIVSQFCRGLQADQFEEPSCQHQQNLYQLGCTGSAGKCWQTLAKPFQCRQVFTSTSQLVQVLLMKYVVN